MWRSFHKKFQLTSVRLLSLNFKYSIGTKSIRNLFHEAISIGCTKRTIHAKCVIGRNMWNKHRKAICNPKKNHGIWDCVVIDYYMLRVERMAALICVLSVCWVYECVCVWCDNTEIAYYMLGLSTYIVTLEPSTRDQP